MFLSPSLYNRENTDRFININESFKIIGIEFKNDVFQLNLQRGYITTFRRYGGNMYEATLSINTDILKGDLDFINLFGRHSVLFQSASTFSGVHGVGSIMS